MIVSCARCKHQGEVYEYYDWCKPRRKMPDVFICDVCAKEVCR